MSAGKLRGHGGASRAASWLGGLGLLLVGSAWLLSLFGGYDVIADVDITRASQGPSGAHWLGTDHLGRDIFWRLVTASEAFFGPGLLAALVALGVGVPVGALAGWLGGAAAGLLRYGFTVVSALPRFVLVLLVCAIYGNEVWIIALVAGAAYVPVVGEAVYERVSHFRGAGFVLAAEAHGVHPLRVLGYHLLWVNCRKLLARHALQLFAFFLLLETTLSYIGGFGVEEPQPSWGNMIAFEWATFEGNDWATRAPMLAIWGVLLSAMLVGELFSEQRGER